MNRFFYHLINLGKRDVIFFLNKVFYDQNLWLILVLEILIGIPDSGQLLHESDFNINRPNLELFAYGQGSGTILVNLGRALQTTNLSAFDSNKDANKNAKKRGIKIEDGKFFELVHNSSVIQACCKEAKKYDVILMCNIIDRHHLPTTLLRNSMECLKPGGVVILSVSLPWRPAFNTKETDFIQYRKKYY